MNQISKKTLEKWRRETLYNLPRVGSGNVDHINAEALLRITITAYKRILDLTQELLDQHLLRKEDPKLDH